MDKRKLFVIGDSISIQYGPYLKKEIEDIFNYDRKRGLADALKDLNSPIGANAGDSRMVLQYLREEELKGVKYDILLINCGLHDIRVDRKTSNHQVEIKEYEENIREIITLAKSMSNNVIWVGITPVIDEVHNIRDGGFFRFSRDVESYDEAAKQIMKDENIKVIDMFNFTRKLGLKEIYFDHVHYKEHIRKLQGEFISKELRK